MQERQKLYTTGNIATIRFDSQNIGIATKYTCWFVDWLTKIVDPHFVTYPSQHCDALSRDPCCCCAAPLQRNDCLRLLPVPGVPTAVVRRPKTVLHQPWSSSLSKLPVPSFANRWLLCMYVSNFMCATTFRGLTSLDWGKSIVHFYGTTFVPYHPHQGSGSKRDQNLRRTMHSYQYFAVISISREVCIYRYPASNSTKVNK